MNFLETVCIAAALATDATLVALSYGLVIERARLAAALKLAATTGIFQAVMPILGFFAAAELHAYYAAWDHWIAFAVFSALGGSVIYGALREDADDGGAAAGDCSCACGRCALGAKKLGAIGVATSLDALAVGAGMRCMAQNYAGVSDVLAPAAIIGVVTFAGAFGAFFVSRCFRRFPKRAAEVFAGLLLFSIGAVALARDLCGEGALQ
ncbi:MAG: manganese efflux pump MntP family protein [Candidatus Spyradosoma sp.]